MTSRAGSALAGIALDPARPEPLHRQLYDALRGAVLSGHLASGSRLASTRAMAVDLGVSRNTVMAAFSQLLAEGYLEGRVGAGTFVGRTLPDDVLRTRAAPRIHDGKRPRGRDLSARGVALVSTPPSPSKVGAPRPFRLGMPRVRRVPVRGVVAADRALLARADARPRRLRRPRRLPSAARGDRAASRDLARRALRRRAGRHRLRIAAGARPVGAAAPRPRRLGLDRGSRLPRGARLVPRRRRAAGAGAGRRRGHRRGGRRRRRRVGRDGVRVAVAPVPARHDDEPRHAGSRSSNGRATAGAWILEDDYDSEYRYAGRPLAALQGLDADGRVIYLGTFSKVMLPSLRLGYLVLPPDIVDAFAAARAVSDRHSPLGRAGRAGGVHDVRHARTAHPPHADAATPTGRPRS